MHYSNKKHIKFYKFVTIEKNLYIKEAKNRKRIIKGEFGYFNKMIL